jgi:hypothetical protein
LSTRPLLISNVSSVMVCTPGGRPVVALAIWSPGIAAEASAAPAGPAGPSARAVRTGAMSRRCGRSAMSVRERAVRPSCVRQLTPAPQIPSESCLVIAARRLCLLSLKVMRVSRLALCDLPVPADAIFPDDASGCGGPRVLAATTVSAPGCVQIGRRQRRAGIQDAGPRRLTR